MPIVTQSRVLPGTPLHATYSLGGTVYSRAEDTSPAGAQTTTSFRSGSGTGYDYDQLSGVDLYKEIRIEGARGRYDNGNEFNTVRKETDMFYTNISITYPYYGGLVEYRGPLFLGFSSLDRPLDLSSLSASQVTAYGSKAISRTIPTQPTAGLAAFVGELREGLPTLIGHQLLQLGKRSFKDLGGFGNKPIPRDLARLSPGAKSRSGKGKVDLSTRSSGSEYLNYQFGIRPFVNDIEKMARAVLSANQTIRQYLRDSGKVVRRRIVVDETSSLSVDDAGSSNRVFISYFPSYGDMTQNFLANNGNTSMVVTTQVTTKTTFSGAYSYFLSAPDGLLGKLEEYDQLANRLLGTRLTPSVVWELTPWSWLIDWFGHVQTFLSNADALSSDNLVMRYGYVMHETHATRTVSTKPLPLSHGGELAPLIKVHTSVRKERYRGSPYGFGVDVGALSPRRWAILGALGMTRSSKSLRIRS